MTETKRYRIDPAPATTHGMGRHVNHDPQSRRYAYPRPAAPYLGAVFHERHVPVFDQGALGSCTGNACLGILAMDPYWNTLSSSAREFGPQSATGVRIPWTEQGAVDLYSAITRADDFEGAYPPDDTGSDGLSGAKVLTSNGVIPGYRHTFSLLDAVTALQDFPLLVGTPWTDSMFATDRLGRTRPQGPTVGGHEWIVDEYVPAGNVGRVGGVLSRSAPYIGGTSSWGSDFGVEGRFYLSVPDFGTLLDDDGDVIILSLPNTLPPAPVAPATPESADVPDADHALATAMRAWLEAKGL